MYVGQRGRQLKVRFNENLRYIKYNNPNSAYAQHILNNGHNFGIMQDTLQLLKTWTNGKLMTCWENYFIQLCQQHGLLMDEQTVNEPNPLLNLVIDRHTTQAVNPALPLHLFSDSHPVTTITTCHVSLRYVSKNSQLLHCL